MRILILNGNVSGGGAAQIARSICDGIKARGEEAYYVAGWGNKDRTCDLVIGKNFIMKAIHAVRREISGGICYSNPYALKKIKSYIKKNNIDVIHVHNIANNYIGIRDIEYLARKYRVVWTLHEMWAFTGHCGHPLECTLWKKGCIKCEQLNNPPCIKRDIAGKIWNEKRKCFVGANIHFVTPSQWLNDRIRESFLGNEDIVTINNGIAFGKDDTTKKKESNVLRLLFVAGDINNRYKGLDLLEKALEIIDASRRIELIIMGEGHVSDKTAEKYQVYYHGKVVKREQKEEIYQSADVLVVPSKAENFPTVILEAFACGLPVIGSNVGGIPELVTNDCGWIIEDNTAEKLSDILQKLTDDKKDILDKSVNCRKKYQEQYTLDSMMNNYFKLYREIADDV